ncbi:MAG: mCpol domain-containing protein [Cyanobacteria bacterium P01_D01_bin.73]
MAEVKFHYVYLDGDKIGNNLRRLLLDKNDEDHDAANSLSDSIRQAMLLIREYLVQQEVEILMCGGDDVLFRLNSAEHKKSLVVEVQKTFLSTTGMTMSAGEGFSIEESLESLDRAKSMKQNTSELPLVQRKYAQGEMEVALYLFVTSLRPDAYINSICHCFENFDLREVILVGIEAEKSKLYDQSSNLKRLKENIDKQLRALQEQSYIKFNQEGIEQAVVEVQVNEQDELSEDQEEELRKEYEKLRRKYAPVNRISIRALDPVLYSNLDEAISSFEKDGDHRLNLYDVTGVRKEYLIEVYTLLRLMEKREIYTFEVYKRLDFNYTDLVFSPGFTHGVAYDYTSLSNLSFTKKSKIILKSDHGRILNASDNNSHFQEERKRFFSLAQQTANEFAKWSTACALIFIVITTTAGWYLVPPSWNFIEPLLSLSPLFALIPVYATQIFLGRGNISLNPLMFYQTLYKWKLKRVKKKFGLYRSK